LTVAENAAQLRSHIEHILTVAVLDNVLSSLLGILIGS